MRKLLMATLVVVASVLFGYVDNASAAPNQIQRGQCGGSISSSSQYIDNLAAYGAVQKAAAINASAGYSARDGSFVQWVRERVIVTKLAAPATVDNYGCDSRGLFPAGKKHLSKGWPVLVALPAKYEKSDIRTKPTRGYKAVTVSVKLVGQATCTNPGKATVKVVIYVKVKAKPPVAKPKPKPAPKPAPVPPGSCNVNNSPGAVVCSTFYVIVTCGNSTIQIGGSTRQEAENNALNYMNQHCNVGTPPPCCVPTPPVPPVPPVCCVPTPPTPPAVQPPMLSNPTNPEEVYPNGEVYRNMCVTVAAKNGNNLTVTFGSTYGTMMPNSITIVSSGVDRVCSAYKAPNDASAIGKYDRITYNVHDNTTGLNGQEVRSEPFPIKAPPTRP